jgi:branched-chain amino acid transport system substrate-binding protein
MESTPNLNRRAFLNSLGVTIGGAGLTGAVVGGAQLVNAAQEPARGKIPDTPYKTGHITFQTGAAALLGEPTLKGHTLAAEEINAQGGLLRRRKIETIVADEAVGTKAVIKEMQRMKLDGKIDLFTGISSSQNTPGARPSCRGAQTANALLRWVH